MAIFKIRFRRHRFSSPRAHDRQGLLGDREASHLLDLNPPTRWIQVPGNASALGLPGDVIEPLGRIAWDFNSDGRKAILMLAMGQGLVRARGHGSYITFEHTIPTEEAVLGTKGFMAEHLGPRMTCRSNDLRAGTSVDFVYGRVAEDLKRGEVVPGTHLFQDHPGERGLSARVEAVGGLAPVVPDLLHHGSPALTQSASRLRLQSVLLNLLQGLSDQVQVNFRMTPGAPLGQRDRWALCYLRGRMAHLS